VAKTGGLLQDGLDVTAGDRVRLSLPSHWLTVTWALACWTVGAVVEPADYAGGPADPAPQVEVFADDVPPRTTARGVVVGLGPFGGPARPLSGVAVPAGTVDAGAEVLGYPDRLVTYDPPDGDSPALARGPHLLDQRSLLDRARQAVSRHGLPPGGRLLAAAPPATLVGLVESVLAPLTAHGSVLLVTDRASLTGDDLQALVDREQVDVVAVPAAARR
jgi:uncharacterized protein (TIGR03089 family)